MKIYTKTGDQGETGLIGGTRVSKSDIRIEAYGTIDELNSFVGLLASHEALASELKTLETIQHRLFVIGSYLATDTNKTKIAEVSIIRSKDIEKIEQEIDKMNAVLPELTAFILPGGCVEASFCHICRTISRRAERKIVEVSKFYNIDNHIIIYTNRLSDYFFTLARYISLKIGAKEILWNSVD
ncbi:MAG: cob(I)yrinic acid a,c-diamide adenosyltransferase [Paludibacter sp.]